MLNLVNELNNITTDTLRNFITTYDNINENVDFDFPYHIKQDVRRFFLNQRVLPNILNCERTGASPLSTPKLNSDVVINVEKNFSDIE